MNVYNEMGIQVGRVVVAPDSDGSLRYMAHRNEVFGDKVHEPWYGMHGNLNKAVVSVYEGDRFSTCVTSLDRMGAAVEMEPVTEPRRTLPLVGSFFNGVDYICRLVRRGRSS